MVKILTWWVLEFNSFVAFVIDFVTECQRESLLYLNMSYQVSYPKSLNRVVIGIILRGINNWFSMALNIIKYE